MDRIEFFLIAIFKWVVILALFAAICCVAYFGVRGAVQLSATAAPATSRASAPVAKFDQNDLIAEIAPKESPKLSASQGSEKDRKAPAEDEQKRKVDQQISELWKAVEAYQIACGQANPLTKEQFADGIRQTNLPTLMTSRGDAYAASQIEFVKTTLASQQIIDLCKSGKKGIFLPVMNYHLKQWNKHIQEASDFERDETARIARIEAADAQQVLASQAQGFQKLMVAAYSFAAFIALAMLLVFSRIERNLRGHKLDAGSAMSA